MAPERYFDAAAKEQESSSSKPVESSGTATTTTAKGKGREPKPQTTLFISSLPFTATSTDLSTLFSDIGPLRRAFVVTDKDTGKSKGVGYVTFALLEDAQKAEKEMQGKSLDGKRKMRIEWAEKKAFGGRKKVKEEGEEDDLTMRDDDAEVEIDTKATAPSSSRVTARKPVEEKDKDAVRTIIITGLAACQPPADDKTIYKRARKIGDVENVTYPAPLSIISTEVSKDVAQVLYRTPNHAMTAVEKLHAHVFKGAQISVVLKKRADGVAKLQAHMRPETKEKRDKIQRKIEEERERARVAKEVVTDRPLKGADVNRGSRLIIRNLPFDVTDRDLRAIFLSYGPIYSIDVPQKIVPVKEENVDDANDAQQDVRMEDEGSASEEGASSSSGEEEKEENSSSSSDGSDDESDSSSSSATSSSPHVDAEVKQSKVPTGKGRGFAFVWMVSRNDATKAIKGINGVTIGRGAAEKAQVKAAKGKAGRDAAKKALEETLKTAQPGRPVAVDWALSKKEWELKKDESEAEETDKEKEEDEDSDLHPLEMDKDSDKDEEEEKDKPSLPSPSEHTTLFIRNLPYQATETELRDVFRAFGPLRYAKVTMDKATNRAKGTGFVCFWQKESADNALKQAHLMEREVGGTTSTSVVGQKNPFSAPSVLTADPSAPLTSSLNLHGRVLSITLAVEKDRAETLTSKNRSAREKSDRRNTYLMREGVPLPGTSLAAAMTEKEIEKRLANFTIRKTQLSKNPSLFVSKTRLSVRQLPLYVSQKMLKKLGIHAAREFDAQVKKGERADVSEDDKVESQALMQEMQLNKSSKRGEGGEDGELSKKKFKKYVGERSTAVIQSKVMLQNDRIDSLTGLGRSRGYGFLEMRSYVDALKVVRYVNGEKSLNKLLIKWYADELQGMVKGLTRDVELDAAESSTAKQEDKEERQARLKRVEKRLAQVQAGQMDAAEEGGGRGGSIMVEFSIENIIVTKKRKERADHSEGAANKRKRRDGDEDGAGDRGGRSYGKGANAIGSSGSRYDDSRSKRARFDDGEDKREQKRLPRRDNWNQKTNAAPIAATSEPKAEKKGASHMGSLIGRKRKEKKSRK